MIYFIPYLLRANCWDESIIIWNKLWVVNANYLRRNFWSRAAHKGYIGEILTSIYCYFFLQYCTLGRLSHEVGWKYQDVVATLEAKRKVKAEVWNKKSVCIKKLRDQVKNDPKVVKRLAPYQKIIASYGHQ